MSLAVWKYPFTFPPPVGNRDEFTVDMPAGARLLTVQLQAEEPCIWALVDVLRAEQTERRFRVCGTGHPMGYDVDSLVYVGTWQQHYGRLVWHLFEVLP